MQEKNERETTHETFEVVVKQIKAKLQREREREIERDVWTKRVGSFRGTAIFPPNLIIIQKPHQRNVKEGLSS